MAITDIIATVSGGAMTGLLAYFGIRYSANKSNDASRAAVEVDQRKVDREQFEEFKRSYREEQNRIAKQLDQTQAMFKSAVGYIRLLRREMVANELSPPPLPSDLEEAGDFFW